MNQEFSPLERAVLEMMTAGTHPLLCKLRTQLGALCVASREETGVGFFLYLDIDRTAYPPIEPRDFTVSDVKAEIQGLAHGAGFVLFVRDGYMTDLEGFAYDEPWPTTISEFQLQYDSGTNDRRVDV